MAKRVFGCQPNDTFVKIMDFVTIFQSQKMSFGLHQSTTYENSQKITTSEMTLWCQPNDNLVKIIDFVKVIECEKNVLERITITKEPFWAGVGLPRPNEIF